MENLCRWMYDEAVSKELDYSLDQSQWSHELPDCPKQKNSLDCGMFVIQYADYLSDNLSFTFNQSSMNTIRVRLCIDIMNGRLITDIDENDTRPNRTNFDAAYLINDNSTQLGILHSQCVNKVPMESGIEKFNEIMNPTDRIELNTDEENEITGDWISKRGTNYNEAKYGNAALLVGREFNFIAQQGNYKFTDVVVKKDNRKEIFLKYYCVDEFRNPTTVPNDSWKYIPAIQVLTTNKRKLQVIIKSIPGQVNTYFGHALVGRICRTDFGKAGIFKGKITGYDSGKDCYIVTYCDNDTREHDLDMILKCLRIK
jgi:Ulp1 protease family, C-terminal catalytic domain